MKTITYQLATEIDRGTPEAPDIETVLTAASITCPDDRLEANLAIARAEAYQGEVSVEDAGPDPVPSGDLEQRVAAVEAGKADWDEMAAAYSEGVQQA